MSAKRVWNKRDEDLLRKYYGNVTTRELCLMLDRSPEAIYNKAKKLGLAKPKKANSHDKEFKPCISRLHKDVLREVCSKLKREGYSKYSIAVLEGLAEHGCNSQAS